MTLKDYNLLWKIFFNVNWEKQYIISKYSSLKYTINQSEIGDFRGATIIIIILVFGFFLELFVTIRNFKYWIKFRKLP